MFQAKVLLSRNRLSTSVLQTNLLTSYNKLLKLTFCKRSLCYFCTDSLVVNFDGFFLRGFINGATLFRGGSGGDKVVGLMMFACAGLFFINALLEIILLRKVCKIRNVFRNHFFFFLLLHCVAPCRPPRERICIHYFH